MRGSFLFFGPSIFKSGALLAVMFAAGAVGAQQSDGEATINDPGLPLEPTRMVRFTTDEGTWMSVDVSADGKQIVFDLLGQLYLLPIGGGRAQALTHGLAWNAQPRFSPDGRQIVFVSDRGGWLNIWIAARDGSHAQQLTAARRGLPGVSAVVTPVWRPDGQAIVYEEFVEGGEHGSGMRLAEVPVAGGKSTWITRRGKPELQEWYSDAMPVFGADPNLIYAARVINDSSKHKSDIMVVDRERNEIKMLTDGSGYFARPVVSHDGHYLVYTAPIGEEAGLRLRDLRTQKEHWLSRQAQRLYGQGGEDSTLTTQSAFTPDDRALVTAFDGHLWRIDIETGARTLIPFTVDVEQPVGPLLRFDYPISDTTFTARAIQQPQLSPDGKRVAFTALDRIWVAELPPSGESMAHIEPRRLTHATVGEFYPTWSLDGKQITYSTWSDARGGAIYRIDATGQGEPTRLTQAPGCFTQLSYTADGRDLVVAREDFPWTWAFSLYEGKSRSMRLMRLPASGGALQDLGDWPGDHPFAPNVYGRLHPTGKGGEIVAYGSKNGLSVLRFGATVQRQRLADITNEWQQPADDARLSPSGRYILALDNRVQQPYLIALPAGSTAADRAEPLKLSLAKSGANAAGARIWNLLGTGVDFIGWTADDRPYFSGGNTLFVSTAPLGASTVQPPTFQRIVIDVAVPRDHASGELLLRGARLITMRGHEIIERGELLLRDGRIAALGPVGTVSAPARTQVIDVTGKTIVPGFIDVHDHPTPSIATGAHTSQVPQFEATLAYGVTTLRDPSGYTTDLMAYGERSASGDLLAPRIFTVSQGVGWTEFGDGLRQDLPQTRDVVRRWSEFYHSETLKQYESGDRRAREFVAMAAFEQGLTPTNECPWYGTMLCLTMAIDGYGAFEHMMRILPIKQDVVQLLVRTGTIQSATESTAGLFGFFANKDLDRHPELLSDPRLLKFLPEARTYKAGSPKMVMQYERPTPVNAKHYADIIAAGGCLAIGSHGNYPPFTAHQEMWFFAEAGVPPHDVLRMGTLCSATQIGHQRDLGSLEVGKIADLVVLEKNPLDDIRNTTRTKYVMKDGRLYEALTLDEVWPRRRSQ